MNDSKVGGSFKVDPAVLLKLRARKQRKYPPMQILLRDIGIGVDVKVRGERGFLFALLAFFFELFEQTQQDGRCEMDKPPKVLAQ